MQSEKRLYKASRFLSHVLRHNPQKANITLDTHGWAQTLHVLENLQLDIADLDWIISHDDKQRFSYNDDKSAVRANQGHSIKNLNIDYIVAKPPDVLFHGTSKTTIPLILQEGIKSMTRAFVHLSSNFDTALNVGKRKGDAVVLKINAKQMCIDGYIIYISANNVHLTDHVPKQYILPMD